jgi:alpha-mannosidase
MPLIHQDGKRLPCQAEKEASNHPLDWRKRNVFVAELPPMQMSRFDIRTQVLPAKPAPELKEKNDKFSFKTNDMEAVVNARTGLIDTYKTNDGTFLKPESFKSLIIDDNVDPWGMTVKSFRNVIDEFKLMSPTQAARFMNIKKKTFPPIHVIEDGEVRTIIEAFFVCGNSVIVQQYKLPKQGTEIEVEIRVFWNEKDKMLKLSIPTKLTRTSYLGQTCFGVQKLQTNGNETVAQKWTAIANEKSAMTCINNGVYGSDCKEGEIRISLLRSAAYAAHPIDDRKIIPEDRFVPRIDQGERIYHFWINGGKRKERLNAIDREALIHNEKPYLLALFPSGDGKKVEPLAILEDDVAQIAAIKKAETSDEYIIRLFEPTGNARATTLAILSAKLRKKIRLGKFEIKTLRFDPKHKTLQEINLMER